MALAIVLLATTAGSMSADSASINASVTVISLEITLDLSTMDARVGDSVRARATITNAGPTRISDVTVELRLDTSALSVRGGLVTTISRLQPEKDTSVSWTICATQPGNYVVLARATVDGGSVESQARLLTIAGERRRGCA